jgi:hypothetical protein
LAASSSRADASVGDLVKAMSADLSRLVRDEIQLAQRDRDRTGKCLDGPWPA